MARVLVPLARQGELHQAQFGVIGPLPQEFGVDGDIGRLVGAGAERRELFGSGDRLHSGLSSGPWVSGSIQAVFVFGWTVAGRAPGAMEPAFARILRIRA